MAAPGRCLKSFKGEYVQDLCATQMDVTMDGFWFPLLATKRED